MAHVQAASGEDHEPPTAFYPLLLLASVSVCPLSSLPFPMAAAAAASTSCASPLLLPSGLTTATPSPLLINQVAIIRLVSPQGRGVPPRRGGFTRSGAERGARRRAEPPGNAECLTNS
jgi:hypothetical protein